MNEKKLYNVSELATLLSVPRTTVNDWLIKYENFLTFELKGKRKVYTQSSLDILQDISKGRDNNLQIFEIEAILEKKYGIHPEVEKPKTAKVPEENAKITSNSTVEKTTELAVSSIDKDSMQLIVKEEFSELIKRMEDLNNQRIKNRKKTNLLLVLTVIIMFVLFALAGVIGLQLINKIAKDNDANKELARQQNSEVLVRFNENSVKLNEMQSQSQKELEAIVLSLNIENDKLKDEMKIQQNELKELIESLTKANKSLEIANIREKEEFAKQQKLILEMLIQKEADIRKLQETIEENQLKNSLEFEKLNTNSEKTSELINNIEQDDNQIIVEKPEESEEKQ